MQVQWVMLSHSRRSFLKSGAGAAAAGLAGCLGVTGGSGPTQLGLNFTVPIENLASLLSIPELQNELQNIEDEYTLDVSQNASTADSLTAMASGEADVALVTPVSYASAVMEEPVPGNISAVGFGFWDAHPDNYGITAFAHPDSGITDPEDIEGAKLGINAINTGIQATYRKQLLQLDLNPEEAVEYVEQGFPTFTAALADGVFDVGIYPATFAVGARDAGYVEVFSSQDVWEEAYPFVYIAAANDSLDSKGDAIRALMTDYTDLVDYLYENRDEVVSLASDHFDLDRSLVDAFFLTEKDYYRDEVEIDFDRFQFIIDEMHRLEFIDDTFDVQEYATNDYLE